MRLLRQRREQSGPQRDLALVRRLLRGSEPAFDAFFRRYFPGLFRFALARLRGDADAAEDIAQSTLVKAIAKLGTYRGEALLFTWLCTFCRHEISAFEKKRARAPQLMGLAEDAVEVRAALDSLAAFLEEDPEARAARKELGRLVRVTLDHLPERYSQALQWKYLEDLPVLEIAERLGIGLKAAESVLTRARMAFRDAFATLAETGRKPGVPA